MSTALLTEEEVSALREAFAPSDAGAPEARPHHFPTAERFPAEWWARIRPVGDEFAEAVARLLSARLRVTARIVSIRVTTTTAFAFHEAAASPCVAALQRGPSPADHVCLEIAPLFALGVLDRMLGGPLAPCSQPRHPTAVDRLLLADLHRVIIAAFEQAWGVASAGDRDVECLDAIPADWLEEARAPVLECAVSLRCGQLEGSLRVGMPMARLETLCGTPTGESPAAQDLFSLQELERRLGDVPLECHVILGEARLALGDLADLRVGDVICLDGSANDPGALRCGDRTLFRVAVGAEGAKLSVRLLPRGEDERSPR
ncbi:MAG: FliM/FliN family flagellar motor switch protein [Armatimonadetes bacterium]|nr:FliM/FliN family flagellar motor switch protein [Armatimonadota bacterium]